MANDTDSNDDQVNDELQPKSDIFNPELDEEKLPEDGETPAASASDVYSSAPVDDPATDDGLDSDELYQEGIAGATNADDMEVRDHEEPRPLESEDPKE